MATYPVKYLHSGMRGAPVLTGQAGTLVALLHAALVTGFGMVTALSASVAAGTATVQFNAGQSFDVGDIVVVAGATPADLNGEARVLTASGNHITFATTAPDGAASGTITVKAAPVGWDRPYSGTNKAVFRSADPAANGHYLRVLDTSAQFARVTGYTAMTTVDAGTGPFPTAAQFSGGGYWHKSIQADGTPVTWKLFGDTRFFFLSIAYASPYGPEYRAAAALCFGDPIALQIGGDPWSTALTCSGSSYSYHRGIEDAGAPSSPGAVATCMARASGGAGSGVLVDARTYSIGALSGADTSLGQYPSSVDGRLRLTPVFWREQGGSYPPPRAVAPGFLYVPQYGASAAFADGSSITGTGDLAGRRLVAVRVATSVVSANPEGVYFIDATGPWR